MLLQQDLGFGLSIPFVTLLLEGLESSNLQVGIAAGAVAVGVLIAAIYARKYVSLLGYRKGIIFATLVCAVMIVALNFSISFISFVGLESALWVRFWFNYYSR